MGGKSQMEGQPIPPYQTQGQPFQQNPIGGYRPSGFTQWQQGHNLGLVGGNQFNRNLPYQQEYNTGNYSGYGRTPQWSNSRWNRGMDTFQTGTWRPPVEGETADVYSGAMGGQQPPANNGWDKQQEKRAAFMRAFQPPKEQTVPSTGTDMTGAPDPNAQALSDQFGGANVYSGGFMGGGMGTTQTGRWQPQQPSFQNSQIYGQLMQMLQGYGG